MSHMSELKVAVMGHPPQINEFRRIRRVFFSRGLVTFGVIVLLLFVIVAVFAPILAPHDPIEMNMKNTLAKPSSEHLLGTDTLGRDTLSRIIYGTRTTLMISFAVVFLAGTVSILLGLLAGYYGGWVNIVIMRYMDAQMAFPSLLLAMFIASMLGGGMRNVIVALSVGLIPLYVRTICAQVLSLKENDYVLAARSLGASNLRIMFYHLLPNCFSPILVLMTANLGMTILGEAGLSFIGIGIVPPDIAWGSMAGEGRAYLASYPLLSLAPGAAIMLVVFAVNMVGDGLRDALDPRLRGLF